MRRAGGAALLAPGAQARTLLEELGLPYRAHAVDITRGEQDAPPLRRDRTVRFGDFSHSADGASDPSHRCPDGRGRFQDFGPC